MFPGETRASTMLNILQIYLYIQLKFTIDLGTAEYQQNVTGLAAVAPSVPQLLERTHESLQVVLGIILLGIPEVTQVFKN